MTSAYLLQLEFLFMRIIHSITVIFLIFYFFNFPLFVDSNVFVLFYFFLILCQFSLGCNLEVIQRAVFIFPANLMVSGCIFHLGEFVCVQIHAAAFWIFILFPVKTLFTLNNIAKGKIPLFIFQYDFSYSFLSVFYCFRWYDEARI